VENPVVRWRHVYAVSVSAYTWRASGKNGDLFIFIFLRIMAKLKTKSSNIVLTPRAMFVPISALLLFLISEVACGE